MARKQLSPKGQKRFLIGFFIVVILLTVVFFLAIRNLDAKTEQNEEITRGLPARVTDVFNSKVRGVMPADIGEFVEKVPFRRYLYFSYKPMYDSRDGFGFTHTYDSKMNSQLGTDQNINAEDIDGIVFVDMGLKTVGHYTTDEAMSELQEKIFSVNPAVQHASMPYYAVNYMTVPDYVVIRRDTIWGGEPPKRIKKGEAGMGKFPKESQIADLIRATIAN